MDFEQLWASYPKKLAKKEAAKAWARLPHAEQLAALAAMPAHIKRWQALGTDKHYIPHLATWLNGSRWEDEIEDAQPAKSQWWASQEGIKAKAIELGMWPPRSGESWHELKARVQQKVAA